MLPMSNSNLRSLDHKAHKRPPSLNFDSALHSFQLFINLFEARYESLEILAQLEIKKMLLDRLVNLLSRGYVIPVVKYIKICWENKDTDVSLIR